eukprot:4480746-Alexandrium_andersonii.AAC.1
MMGPAEMQVEAEWADAGGRELDDLIPRPTCLTGGTAEASAPRAGIFVGADDFRRELAGGHASGPPARGPP